MTPPDTRQALAMLQTFASVGAKTFDVTLLDIREQQKDFQSARSVDELSRHMSGRLEAATRSGNNIIIRPRSTTALLVQLDDYDDDRAAKIEPHAFMIVQTSPGNNQVWLAVSDGPQEGTEAAKQLRKRLRKGAGSDKNATGATRLAGSQNIKPKYAPSFPIVTLSQTNQGRTVTLAGLEAAGLIAPPEAVTPPPASVPPRRPRIGPPPKHWPEYDRALSGAPLKPDGSGHDRSLADFMFSKWAAQRGWEADEIADKLLEVSDKARERAAKGDRGYAELTGRNAVATVEREKGRGRNLNPSPFSRS